MTEQIIEVEADSLEEAREQLKSLIPEGLHILSEQVVSEGGLKTAQAVAEITEEAFAKAQSEIPINAVVLEKRELTAPEEKVITVEAFDEQGANQEARRQIANTAIIRSHKLVLAGKKGLLGIGKKSNQYETSVFQQAVVEITYKMKAKISARIGEKGVVGKLLDDLQQEYNLEARINAAHALGLLKDFVGMDVIPLMVKAAKDAYFELEVKRMSIAVMQNVNPNQIVVAPHVDSTRLTKAVIEAISKLTHHQDKSVREEAQHALREIQTAIGQTNQLFR